MATPLVNVGVDVGGTNTDAVVVCDGDILGWSKQTTTDDVTSGLVGAVSSALDCASNACEEGLAGIRFNRGVKVQQVNIGTTHFLNAVLQQQHLIPVAVIRLCGPVSRSLPPFSDFPKELENVIGGPVFMVNGGYLSDGVQEISALDKEEIEKCIAKIKNDRISHIVVSGIFSVINNAHELQVGKWIKQFYPMSSVTLSHEIAPLGTLLRENSAILNESLKPLSKKIVAALSDAFRQLHLCCPFYLTQNDGTLISPETVMEFPVFTFSSGPTNSMRGAAFLEGVKDAVVIDIGGVSTDAGLLQCGFPKRAPSKIKIGGVSTSFHMPDTSSIALGGGSLVRFKGDTQPEVCIGPESVGHKLRKEAVVFGGKTLTATDISVAVGHCNLGNMENRSHWLPDVLAKAADDSIHQKIEKIVAKVKKNEDEVPVILVGGGSVLVDAKRRLQGASQVIKPKHYEVANAIGAALSHVSAQVDVTVKASEDREKLVQAGIEQAKKQLIKQNTDPSTIEILEIMEHRVLNMQQYGTKLTIKAVGNMNASKNTSSALKWKGAQPVNIPQMTLDSGLRKQFEKQVRVDVNATESFEELSVNINSNTGEWTLSVNDVECIAIGAGILGCGGGGNPHLLKLWAQRLIAEGKEIRVISARSFSMSAGEKDLALMCGVFGAPTEICEMLYSSQPALTAVQTCMDLVSATDYTDVDSIKGVVESEELHEKEGVTYITDLKVKNKTNKEGGRIAALFSAEIGGANSMAPFVIASALNLPVLDCDLKGRSFPKLQMQTNNIYGDPLHPAVFCGHDGRSHVCVHADSSMLLEKYFNAVSTEQGGIVAYAGRPLTAGDTLKKTVLHSTSRAWRLGRAVITAKKQRTSPIQAMLDFEKGMLICTGKITDVHRETAGGFTKSTVKIQGNQDFQSQTFVISFQNENLIAEKLKEDGSYEVVASVPDLISVIELESGEALSTDEYNYGLDVATLALPAPPSLRTVQALAVVGPSCFGFDHVTYKPVGEFYEHSSMFFDTF